MHSLLEVTHTTRDMRTWTHSARVHTCQRWKVIIQHSFTPFMQVCTYTKDLRMQLSLYCMCTTHTACVYVSYNTELANSILKYTYICSCSSFLQFFHYNITLVVLSCYIHTYVYMNTKEGTLHANVRTYIRTYVLQQPPNLLYNTSTSP